MPKKNDHSPTAEGANTLPATKSKFSVVRWFNPSPNDEDRRWLDDNDDKLIELAFTLLEGIQPDGRFTSKFDIKTGRWLAILFVGSSAEGVELDAMSVRGASAIDALFLLAYFHLVKFEGAWALPAAGGEGRWG
jgi:hypothetical protein